MWTFVSSAGHCVSRRARLETTSTCRSGRRRTTRWSASEGEQKEENDEFMNELERALRKESEKKDVELVVGDWRNANVAIAIMYKQGDAEGIYTVGLENGKDLIVTFENKEDALRYLSMLEAESFPSGALEYIETRILDEICKQTGASFVYVPTGVTFYPPSTVNSANLNEWDELSDRKSADSDKLNKVKNKLEDLFNS
mmetsp:Transcript_7582/g.22994  ORF Transcript_7582/g.22994 Transcript_7582/m.22994 type:complete len:199 (+) Transcript_7582:103-699(+)